MCIRDSSCAVFVPVTSRSLSSEHNQRWRQLLTCLPSTSSPFHPALTVHKVSRKRSFTYCHCAQQYLAITPNNIRKFKDFSLHPKDEYNRANATSVTAAPSESTAIAHSPGCAEMTTFHGTSSSKLTGDTMGIKVKFMALMHLLPHRTF